MSETEGPSEEPISPEPPGAPPDETPFPTPEIERIEKGDEGSGREDRVAGAVYALTAKPTTSSTATLM